MYCFDCERKDMAQNQPPSTQYKIPDPVKKGTSARAPHTRQDILRLAADIASREGLEGLTIASLSKVLWMRKSFLFAHFGSKEEPQFATIDTARRIFIDAVIAPTLAYQGGVPRLRAVLEKRVSYTYGAFSTVVVFAAASAEFDRRLGQVQDQLAMLTRACLQQALEDETTQVQKLGQLDYTVEPVQRAFDLHALVQETNWAYSL